MKRFFIFTLFLIFLASPAIAANSTCECTEARVNVGSTLWTIDCDLVASSVGGSFSQTTHATMEVDGFVFKALTNPGSLSPTDQYDITLVDETGIDIMGGALADRSNANTEWIGPYSADGATVIEAPVEGPLYINVTNNSVASATFALRLYVLRPESR